MYRFKHNNKWSRHQYYELTYRKEILSKSPLLTGEDAEGAEGLKALMGLRSSLSPIVPILEEA